MTTREARDAVASRVQPVSRGPVAPAQQLDQDERRAVVTTFITLIQGLYAHLPRKRATYGNDPVQRLRSLLQRVDSVDESEFHRSIAEIVTDLRDAHTRYIGPARLHKQVAFLPILVERYSDETGEHYVVSKVFAVDDVERTEFAAHGFVEGVQITHWNGVRIGRAVELHADWETGGRPDARRARALESLTLRPLLYSLPPDEEWVIITFLNESGRSDQVKLVWRCIEEADEPKALEVEGAAKLAYAGNPAAEAARRVKKLLFATDRWYEARSGRQPSLTESVAAYKESEDWFTGRFQDVVAARQVKLPFGTFGHLRLWSFDLSDDDGFLAEVIELLRELPRTGLILDLRGNPGGLIWAAERLLQLFTPNEVVPTRFSILATDLTRTMAAAPQNRLRLAPWRRSLDAAVVSGELYSRSVPLTPPERCNDIGQRYPGPVVAIVDALTYSAGDLFAAGFVDNRIGTLVSVDEATGAGGANVWYPAHVAEALGGTSAAPEPLPKGVMYTIAFRRAVRVGDVAGTGIEDLGIPGHVRRPLTKTDLTKGNSDLMEFCGRLLISEPVTDLTTRITGDILEIETINLNRVDVYVDGRPDGSHRPESQAEPGKAEHKLDAPWSEIQVIGYVGDIRRQRRILRPDDL